jgi:hypothetical protein
MVESVTGCGSPFPSDRAFVEQVAAELARDLESWKDDDAKVWNQIRLSINPGGGFGASVELERATNWSTIDIFGDSIARLRRSLHGFVTSADSLVVRWQSEGSHTIHQEDFGAIAGARAVPPQENREWLADFLTRTAARFLYYHEMAHVIRGHLAHELQQSGRARFAYNEQDGARSLTPLQRWRWRAFEVDADMFGSDLFARLTALSTWRGLDVRDRRRLCSLVLFAAATTFVLLDLEQRPRRACGVHQPPFVRFLVVLDTLGPALRRELGLRDAGMNHAARAAVGWIGRFSAHLGNMDRRWPARDRAGWTTALRRHDRAMKMSDRVMKRLLAGKSTLLPDVGKDLATPPRRRSPGAADSRR